MTPSKTPQNALGDDLLPSPVPATVPSPQTSTQELVEALRADKEVSLSGMKVSDVESAIHRLQTERTYDESFETLYEDELAAMKLKKMLSDSIIR